jgi:hypothetical protein
MARKPSIYRFAVSDAERSELLASALRSQSSRTLITADGNGTEGHRRAGAGANDAESLTSRATEPTAISEPTEEALVGEKR